MKAVLGCSIAGHVGQLPLRCGGHRHGDRSQPHQQRGKADLQPSWQCSKSTAPNLATGAKCYFKAAPRCARAAGRRRGRRRGHARP